MSLKSTHINYSGGLREHPFGMITYGREWQTGSDYRYGFNGKEQDDEVIGDGNIYDYGLRIYNPRIGKFLSADSKIKSYPWYTPYQFAGNKPIAAIDLDGAEEYFVVRWYDINANLAFDVVIKVPDAFQVVGQNGSIYLELNANNAADVATFQTIFGINPASALSSGVNKFTPADEGPGVGNGNFKFSQIIQPSATSPYLVGTYQAPTTADANGLRPYERDIVNDAIAKGSPIVAIGDNGGTVTAHRARMVPSAQRRIVYFDTRFFNLDATSTSVIDIAIKPLSMFPSLTANIEGNTDTDNTTDYNNTLGMNRAISVGNYMISRGIGAARLSETTNGESKATGTTPSAKLLDRNATIDINYPKIGE